MYYVNCGCRVLLSLLKAKVCQRTVFHLHLSFISGPGTVASDFLVYFDFVWLNLETLSGLIAVFLNIIVLNYNESPSKATSRI